MSAELLRRLLSALGCNDSATLVLAALGAGVMGALLLVAVRTFRQGQRRKKIMGPPLIFAGVRVTSFWIRHSSSSIGRRLRRAA